MFVLFLSKTVVNSRREYSFLLFVGKIFCLKIVLSEKYEDLIIMLSYDFFVTLKLLPDMRRDIL